MALRRPAVTYGPARVRACFSAMLALVLVSGLGGTLGCESRKSPAPSASASGKPKTPDRLAPGELAEGKSTLFGLKVPVGMTIDARFAHSAHASGVVSAEGLANYVRQRVEVARVELAASGTVFPQASIRGADPARHYRIEVSAKGRNTKLSVHWLNPPKPPAVPNLSEAERWRRAGLSPDGKQIEQQQLD